jgi:hypothetical protein
MRTEVRVHAGRPVFGDHFAAPIGRKSVNHHPVETRQPTRFSGRNPTDLVLGRRGLEPQKRSPH